MLANQTVDKLNSLRLQGMAQALKEQMLNSATQSFSFDERFGLLVDAEYQLRENRKVARLDKQSNLPGSISIEDIDFITPRGLNRELYMSLATAEWVKQHGIVIFTGATGLGKSTLAQALARQAVRKGYSVRYERMRRLLSQLQIAQADGSIAEKRSELAKTNLLLLDDFGLGAPLTQREADELMEVVYDRDNRGALIFTSQLPIEKWHDFIGNAHIADAILDRLIHRAHRIDLRGETMRKLQMPVFGATEK